MSGKEKCLIILGIILLIAVVLCGHLLFVGYILSKLWLWFIMPVFHLPELSLGYAMGLGLIFDLILIGVSNQTDASNLNSNQLTSRALNLMFARPLSILFIGWLIHIIIN
jgi:membrane protein CcdC involved in cytochrome C biogenesis